MDEGEPAKPVVVAVGDTPDARLFVELSSHAADLTEASAALDLALNSPQADVASDVRPFLIGFAVVAYCRCFMPSKVRRTLADYIDLAPGMVATHDAIKAFRNQTIAHSQSELSVTYPVAFLDAKTLELQFVAAATLKSTLPRSVAQDFAILIDAVQAQVEVVLVPIRGRLETVVRATDPEVLMAAVTPRVIDKMADEFHPRSSRPRYPTGHTFYWDREG